MPIRSARKPDEPRWVPPSSNSSAPSGPDRPESRSRHVPALKEIALQVLALPREAGTPEAAKARELVATYLAGLGYTVVTQGFTFPPSSLRAFPIFGAGLGGLALVLFPLLASNSLPPWGALALWMTGLLALAIVTT